MPLLPDGVISSQLLWRWVQRYGPELEQRLRRHFKPTNKSWRVDETYGALSSARFRRVQVLRRSNAERTRFMSMT